MQHIVAHVREVYVESDKEYRHAYVYGNKFLLGKELFEIENGGELLPESALDVRFESGAVFHGEKRHYTHGDYQSAHNEEEPHIVFFRADNRAARERSHDSAYNGLSGERRTYLTAVMIVHQIVGPGVEPGVVAHRTEETHHGVRYDYHYRRDHQLLFGNELGQAEGYRTYSPGDISERDERFSGAFAVGESAEEERCESGCDRADRDHPRDYSGVFGDLSVNKCVEPLVFDVPAKLTRYSQSPDQQPSPESGARSFFVRTVTNVFRCHLRISFYDNISLVSDRCQYLAKTVNKATRRQVRVALNAIVRILFYCEILPREVLSLVLGRSAETGLGASS